MGRYPAEPLESKLAWMREKQKRSQMVKKAAQRGLAAPLAVPPPSEASSELPQMLRVNEVAEALGVSRQTVERWFGHRAVVVQGRNNRVMLIPRRFLDDWIREHTASSR